MIKVLEDLNKANDYIDYYFNNGYKFFIDTEPDILKNDLKKGIEKNFDENKHVFVFELDNINMEFCILFLKMNSSKLRNYKLRNLKK